MPKWLKAVLIAGLCFLLIAGLLIVNNWDLRGSYQEGLKREVTLLTELADSLKSENVKMTCNKYGKNIRPYYCLKKKIEELDPSKISITGETLLMATGVQILMGEKGNSKSQIGENEITLDLIEHVANSLDRVLTKGKPSILCFRITGYIERQVHFRYAHQMVQLLNTTWDKIKNDKKFESGLKSNDKLATRSKNLKKRIDTLSNQANREAQPTRFDTHIGGYFSKNM